MQCNLWGRLIFPTILHGTSLNNETCGTRSEEEILHKSSFRGQILREKSTKILWVSFWHERNPCLRGVSKNCGHACLQFYIWLAPWGLCAVHLHKVCGIGASLCKVLIFGWSHTKWNVENPQIFIVKDVILILLRLWTNEISVTSLIRNCENDEESWGATQMSRGVSSSSKNSCKKGLFAQLSTVRA